MRITTVAEDAKTPLPEQEAITADDIENVSLDEFEIWARKYFRVLAKTGSMEVAAAAVGRSRQAIHKYAKGHPKFASVQGACKNVFMFEMIIAHSVSLRQDALKHIKQRMDEGKLSDMALLAIAFNKFGTS